MTFHLSLIPAFALLLSIHAADAPNPANLPPLPPLDFSPLQQFRNWLDMDEADREKALAEYPAEKQKILREKLQTYQLLPTAQRNRRLNMLELRLYLKPLMSMAPEDRAPFLQNVPVPLQPMVMDRLLAWDKLDATTRSELLESERSQELVMAYFAQIRRGIPQNQIINALSEQKREELQKALAAWNKTPLDDLRQKTARVAAFFETQPAEQAKTLSVLSTAEKAEIQHTLDRFAQLSVAQRRACVSSFQKFAAMNPEERNAFLRNAARWQAMSPEERETWKKLVNKLPPMPPEPRELPPLPPGSEPPRQVVTTNLSALGN